MKTMNYTHIIDDKVSHSTILISPKYNIEKIKTVKHLNHSK